MESFTLLILAILLVPLAWVVAGRVISRTLVQGRGG